MPELEINYLLFTVIYCLLFTPYLISEPTGSGSILCMLHLHTFAVFNSAPYSRIKIQSQNQCCGSITFWGGSGSADPCL